MLELIHLEGIYELLDELQVGFLLVSPDDQIRHASYLIRQMAPRARVGKGARQLLGEDLWEQLCQPVLEGHSAGTKWRELELESKHGGPSQLSARSLAVRFPDDAVGVLLALMDVSAEIGMSRRLKELLARQEEINAELRGKIAAVLREHEDDVAQFNEILQIAPAIFATFTHEANAAVDLLSRLCADGGAEEDLVAVRRALHTLKGNARSLGLNFIGGRAHEVEERITRRTPTVLDAEALAALGLVDLAADLRRAVERAAALRARLGQSATKLPVEEGSSGFDRLSALVDVEGALREAVALLPDGHPARAPLATAQRAFATVTLLPLEQLFEFLKVTIHRTADAEGLSPPLVETSGGGIAVVPTTYRALSQALPHVLRNAVCHGIEPAEERRRAGKSPIGHITVVAHEEPGALVLRVRDDGRGLAVEALRARAAAMGIQVGDEPTGAELQSLMLREGLSTAAETTLDRGRGVGAGAAAHAIAEVGGTMSVWSEPGKGLEVAIEIPRPGPDPGRRLLE